jgi:bifunctional DNase/RNase
MMERMLEAEIWSVARIDQGNAVLLRPLGMDLVVPVFIGALEVHAILLGLGNIKAKRPLSCDLFLEMIHRLGISLSRVEVHEIREDVFHARIFLSGREYSPPKLLVMDSRPSDAFALAVREKCPVFMAAKVLDRTGIPADIFVEEETEEDAKGEDNSLAARRRRLQAELEESIEKEAYERAAEIRDLLILLDQQLEQERRGKEIT